MAQRILIAWEDERSRSDLARQLEERGYTVLALSPDAEWLGDLLRSSVDVLVVAPGPHVERVCALLERAEEPRATIVVHSPTATGTAGPAPRERGETLLEEIGRALTERRLRLEIQALRALVADRVWNGVLAGSSLKAARLRREVQSLEGTDSPAFLVGPSGSGRRYVARAIHLLSARAGGPFHEIDCEIQPPTTTSVLLFGRDDGPGRRRPGWIERSHGGTVALLGMARLGEETQLRLADFLATGRITAVTGGSGGAPPPFQPDTGFPSDGPTAPGERTPSPGLPADVRILATLGRDPEVEIAQGWLSPALWRAMRGIVVRVPSLAERMEDLPELIDVLLRHLGADGVEVTAPALRWLEGRPWRGNLAELELVLGRALLRRRSRQRIDVSDLES